MFSLVTRWLACLLHAAEQNPAQHNTALTGRTGCERVRGAPGSTSIEIPRIVHALIPHPHLLVELALPVCDASQSNACEEVDAEAHVLHAVLGEDAAEVLLQAGLLQPLIQLHHAQVLTQLLQAYMNTHQHTSMGHVRCPTFV